MKGISNLIGSPDFWRNLATDCNDGLQRRNLQQLAVQERSEETIAKAIELKFTIVCMMIKVVTPHAQRERGKVIDRGVHIYIYVCSQKKNLNRTLEIDSPFQTLTVGLLVEFID